jgi:hypothetical protein
MLSYVTILSESVVKELYRRDIELTKALGQCSGARRNDKPPSSNVSNPLLATTTAFIPCSSADIHAFSPWTAPPFNDKF